MSLLTYTIPSLIKLDEIASAVYTTVKSLKGLNQILVNMPESRLSGLEIQIKQTTYSYQSTRWPVLGNHNLTDAELQLNLNKLNQMSETRVKQAQKTNTQAQTKKPDEVVDTSECAQSIFDLVHITQQKGDKFIHGFIPLTERESNEFAEEEKAVADSIAEFYAKLDCLGTMDADGLAKEKTALLQKMIEEMPDRAKYGDILEGGKFTRDKDGNKIPDPSAPEKPTQVIEIRRLNAQKTSENSVADEAVEIKDPPALMNSKNANIKSYDSVISFQYVRGTRFKDMIRRLYTIPNSTQAPWYDTSSNKINTKKLLQSIKEQIKEVKDNPWDKKLEVKLETTHEFINVSAHEWKDDKTWPLPSINAKINVSGEAQVFRFSSNASAGVKWEPTENRVTMAAKIQAQAALAMGETSFKYTWPEGEAAHITHRYGKAQDAVVDFGCFQFEFEIKLSGFAGASGMLGADIQAEMKNGMPQLKASSDFPGSPPGAQAGVEVFVGVRVGCGVKGAVQWQDTLVNQAPWKKLAEVGAEVSGYLGATAVAKVHIMYANGYFYLRFKVGAAWGVGASGEWAAGIDVGNIGTMAHFVYNSLLKVDFSKVDWVEPDAFAQFTMLGVALVCQGLDFAASAVESLWNEVTNTWRYLARFINDLFSDWSEEKAAQLALFIKADVRKGALSVVLHLSPEGKGQLLNKLIYTDLLNFWNPKLSDIAVDGIFDLLAACQSWEEYHLVFACMNDKGTLEPKATRNQVMKENELKVATFIARSKRSNETVIATYYRDQANRPPTPTPQEVERARQWLKDLIDRTLPPIPDCPVELNRCIIHENLAMLRGGNFDHYV
jgi:hypothetical protein